MKNLTSPWKFALVLYVVMLGPIPNSAIFASEVGNGSEQVGNDTIPYRTYRGNVCDEDSNAPLVFATVSIVGSNIATVTNSDGDFTIKVPKQSKVHTLQITHIGYRSFEVPLSSLTKQNNKLRLKMATIPLDAVNVYPNDPLALMHAVMHKVGDNYPTKATMMKGFYRETIKRNRTHVGIAEAVVDISKGGYLDMKDDQVKIFKGRKTEDVTRMDTLVFRLKGGPATAILMDIIKHPYSLLSDEDFAEYDYKMENVIEINGKPHYVVGFTQKSGGEFPLYNGKYYIETNSLAIASAEFNLNLEDPVAATRMLIQKKPIGLKVTTRQVSYLVNYREQDGKYYFNYARGEMSFKFNWKKKVFNTNYSAMIEMAITDRNDEEVERFKGPEKFKTSQIFTEKVSSFGDVNFWGENNTIVPDESIQAAIHKLNKKGKF